MSLSKKALGILGLIMFLALGLSANNIFATGEGSTTPPAPIVEDLPEAPAPEGAFITVWETTSPNETIVIPTLSNAAYSYNYTLYCGEDATSETRLQEAQTGNGSCTYENPGQYTIQITGDFPRIFINGGQAKDKILEVKQWGNIKWKDMNSNFKGVTKLAITATDKPDLSDMHRYSLEYMFADAKNFDSDISNWDVSKITNFGGTFFGAEAFNQNISGWDTSSATNMAGMFYMARKFNQDISSWKTENVTSMFGMFGGAFDFNQDIGGWNVSRVTNMYHMFYEAKAFDQDLSDWKLGALTDNSDLLVQYFDQIPMYDEYREKSLEDFQNKVLNIFKDSGLNQENYDLILNGWADETPTAINVGDVPAQFCDGLPGKTTLVKTKNWQFNDEGLAEGCEAKIVEITSQDANKTYAAGDKVTIEVTFDKPVTVKGIPKLKLNSGEEIFAVFIPEEVAEGEEAESTIKLTFEYTVAEGDQTDDLNVLEVVVDEENKIIFSTIPNGEDEEVLAITELPTSENNLAGLKDLVIGYKNPTVEVANPSVYTLNNPTFKGSGEPTATIQAEILNSSNNLVATCTATVNAEGRWTCGPESLVDGNYTIRVVQTLGELVSEPTEAKAFQVTTSVTVVPSDNGDTSSNNSSSSGNYGSGSGSGSGTNRNTSTTSSNTSTNTGVIVRPNTTEQDNTSTNVDETITITTPTNETPSNLRKKELANGTTYYVREDVANCEVSQNIVRDFRSYKNGDSTTNNSFPDTRNVTFKSEIESLVDNDVVSGVNGVFEPSRGITRAEFLKIVFRSHCIEYRDNTSNSARTFGDVGSTSWQYPLVSQALDLGIITSQNANFNPNQQITKAEAVKILFGIALVDGGYDLANHSYSDVNSADWVNKYATFGNALGVFSDIDSKNSTSLFRPNASISREDASNLIVRTLETY